MTIADEIRAVYKNLTPAGVHAVESKTRDALNIINECAEKGDFQGAVQVIYNVSKGGKIGAIRQLKGADYTQHSLSSLNQTRAYSLRGAQNIADNLETMATNASTDDEILLNRSEEVLAALLQTFGQMNTEAVDVLAGLQLLATVDEKARAYHNIGGGITRRAGESTPKLEGGLETLDASLNTRYVLMLRELRTKLEAAKQAYNMAKVANQIANDTQRLLYGIDLGGTMMPTNQYFEFAASREEKDEAIPSGSGYMPREVYVATPAKGAVPAKATPAAPAGGKPAP